MPLVDDLMVANLHRADFSYPIARRPTARRLARVEAVIDPADFCTDADVPKVRQPRELIAADCQ